MRQLVLKVVKFLLFFSVGAVIFWFIYKDQDIEHIKSVLKNEVNYSWIVLSLFIGLLSHISRTIRWGLMIRPISHKPGFLNTFMAVMVGYLMNLAFPRMGEVSRCGVLSRYEKISFTKLFGTVVAERALDVISLMILLLLVIVLQFGQMVHFVGENPEVLMRLKTLFTNPLLLLVLVGLLAAAIIFRKMLKHTMFYKKIYGILMNFRAGFVSILSIKNKGWLIFHSIAIWLLYYLMLYVVFFAFDFTRNLSPVAGLTTFVLASFGMVAPVQGGIGAWHFMSREALALYGVAYENGIIFAFVSHTATTSMIILVGVISLLVLPFVNRRRSAEEVMPVREQV